MPRVLLVEGGAAQALYFQRELLRYHMQIEVAGDSSSGFAAARRSQPDVIVLDVELSERDGYALCRSLRADPQTNGIPVLLLTPPEEAGDTLEGMAVEVVDAIPKDSFAAYNLIAALRQLGVL